MEWSILDTLLDTSVDSLSLYDDDFTDPDYVPTPTPTITLTQTEVELGDPVEEFQEPGPQPETEGKEGESC